MGKGYRRGRGAATMDIINKYYFKIKDSSTGGGSGTPGERGAPCTISKIEHVDGEGTYVTFEWTENDGSVKTEDMLIPDGVGVSNIYIDDDTKHLMFLLTDGKIVDAGLIPSGGGEPTPTATELYIHHIRLHYHGFNESEADYHPVPGASDIYFDYITTKKDKYNDLAVLTKDIWDSITEKYIGVDSKETITFAVNGHCDYNDNEKPFDFTCADITKDINSDKFYWVIFGYTADDSQYSSIGFDGKEYNGGGNDAAYGISSDFVQKITLDGINSSSSEITPATNKLYAHHIGLCLRYEIDYDEIWQNLVFDFINNRKDIYTDDNNGIMSLWKDMYSNGASYHFPCNGKSCRKEGEAGSPSYNELISIYAAGSENNPDFAYETYGSSSSANFGVIHSATSLTNYPGDLVGYLKDNVQEITLSL